DLNAFPDVFVRDRQTGTTERASVDSAGVEGNDWSEDASISADGRYVAFHSLASNLVAGDTDATPDVFVHGPYPPLGAAPETVTAGATLALTTWKGQPGGQALLAVV